MNDCEFTKMSCCRRNRSPRKSQTFRPAHMELIHRKMPNPFMVFKDFAKTWFSGEARLGRPHHLRLWRNDPKRLSGTSLASGINGDADTHRI